MELARKLDKEKLRRDMIRKRLSLDPTLALKWSEWVQRHFVGAACYLAAKSIGLYAAFDQEVDTKFVFERARADGKTLAFPRITGPGEMVFLKVKDYDQMRPNKWGIPEPEKAAAKMPAEKLDLVVVPGVAFGRNGCRLGFGQGFYDRLLKKLKPGTITVGFAYGFQVLDQLPCSNHDQKVKRVVTEQGFLKICL